jgi:hypothetical protein
MDVPSWVSWYIRIYEKKVGEKKRENRVWKDDWIISGIRANNTLYL